MEDFTNLQISIWKSVTGSAKTGHICANYMCSKRNVSWFLLGISNFCKLHMVTCKFLHKP